MSSLSIDPSGPCVMPSRRSDSRRRTWSRSISDSTYAHAERRDLVGPEPTGSARTAASSSFTNLL